MMEETPMPAETRRRRFSDLLPVIAAMLAVLAVCLLFSSRKSGMFIDEIYTYGLSNSHYMPFLGNGEHDKGELPGDQIFTQSDLFDYVAVTEGDRFDFGSVYYNQERDVHPPLHYWIINLASSLVPHTFSKWIGLIPDLIIYLAVLMVLYFLCMELFDNRWVATAAILLYGLSYIGLSTMLMIRMYVLVTFFSVLLALFVAKLMHEEKRRWYPLILLTIFLGMLTQYYFVFYAFFLCGFYVIHALTHRRFKSAGVFAMYAFAGVGLSVLAFPAMISQLTADNIVSGGNALDNLSNTSQWVTRFRTYFSFTRHGLKAAILIGFVCVLLLLIFFRRLLKAQQGKRLRWDSLWIILPSLPTLLLSALLAPVLEERYVYNIMPILTLASALALSLLAACFPQKKTKQVAEPVVCLIVAVLSLFVARSEPPGYLYPEYASYDAIVSEHADDPCLYMTGYFAPVTQDLLQLLTFDDVCVADEASSPLLKNYLDQAGSNECVVYIDISDFWGSGFDPDEMLSALLAETDYTAYQPLYQNALSDTYLLTK